MEQKKHPTRSVFRRIWLVDSAVQFSIVGLVFKALIVTFIVLIAIQKFINTYGESIYFSWNAGFILTMIFVLCSIGGAFSLSLYISHKIAGPMFSLQRHMDSVLDNKTRDPIKFRKSDHYQQLAEKYNRIIARMSELENEVSRRKTGSS